MRCAVALMLIFNALPAPLLAASECAEEVAAYEAAKGSFHANVEAIYNVSLPEIHFKIGENGPDIGKLVVDDVDFSKLSEVTGLSRALIKELQQFERELSTSVNRLFLKRRQIPEVFLAGADLSRCLARLEMAEVARQSAAAAEHKAATDARQTKCFEAKAEAPPTEDEVELAAAITELIEKRDQSSDKEEIVAYSVLIALAEGASQMRDAAECLDGEAIGEEMAIAVGFAFTIVFSMGDRKSLQQELAPVFGRELDFGYVDLSEGEQ